MVNVVIGLDFDLDDESDIPSLLDVLTEAVMNATEGVEPSIGLQVDGEHRDPDEPDSSLF